MMYIRIILLIILLTGLPEFPFIEFGFDVYSNTAQPPMSDRRGSLRPSRTTSSRPPMAGRRNPLQRSLRSRYIQQEGWEAGVILGTSHSLTKIGTGLPSFLGTHWEATDLNAGAFGRYRINNFWAVKTSFHYARIHSADSLLSDTNNARYKRDFAFENQIFELNVKGEFYIPRLFDNFPIDIYGFLGVAVFYHNPQTTQEGQPYTSDEEFSLIQPAIPMGLGALYPINENFRIGIDIGHRWTFTDYLGGFTRPASESYDSYFLGSVKVSYFFGDGRGRFVPY